MAPITPRMRALLNVIRYAEGTADPIKGYTTMFGGGQFDPSKGHPNKVVRGGGYASAAAGAYQFMPNTWKGVATRLKLPDFSPGSQDLGAIQLIKDRGVDPNQPLTPQLLNKLAPEWASLPTLKGTSYYGQPVKAFNELKKIYESEFNKVNVPPAKPKEVSSALGLENLVAGGNLFGKETLDIMKQGIQEELLTSLIQPEEDEDITNLFTQLLNQTRPYYS